VRAVKVVASAVVRGPSADAVPAANVTVICWPAGRSRIGRNATTRPFGAAPATLAAAGSAATSSGVASLIGRPALPALTRVVARTAFGSTCWSKTATKTGSSFTGPPVGANCLTAGGGVANLKVVALPRVAPFADRVPAGTVTT